jgi:molecular chaperone GrpE
MADHHQRPARVKVMDKRRAATRREEPGTASPESAPETAGASEEASGQESEMEQAPATSQESALLDDLRRLQAEFDNYRKRVLREQTAMTSRASARLVDRLLPVLDNLERAVAHGEGGPGIELVLKELRQTLEQEGLVEIEAEGAPFDPRLHEAFQVADDPGATEAVVRSVYRRGYRMGDQVLRPAMVVVARPPEEEADASRDAGAGDEHELQAPGDASGDELLEGREG